MNSKAGPKTDNGEITRRTDNSERDRFTPHRITDYIKMGSRLVRSYVRNCIIDSKITLEVFIRNPRSIVSSRIFLCRDRCKSGDSHLSIAVRNTDYC